MEAYARLLRPHEQHARRLAATICGPEGDDAVQDAFVKGWSSIARFREESGFGGWLLRIVANESRNRLRASGRRRHYELQLAEDRADGGAAPSPEAAVLVVERRKALLDAVNTLPAAVREVVVCRHLVGLSEAETAGLLDIPAGTVKSRLARGLERLRAAWDEEARL